jgi:hypothetical protein
VRATFDALKNEDSPRAVAARRGLKANRSAARAGSSRPSVSLPHAASAESAPGSASRRRNKLHRVATLPDTPTVRGMIAKVHHLVRVLDDAA